jgi:hypothetical protein
MCLERKIVVGDREPSWFAGGGSMENGSWRNGPVFAPF